MTLDKDRTLCTGELSVSVFHYSDVESCLCICLVCSQYIIILPNMNLEIIIAGKATLVVAGLCGPLFSGSLNVTSPWVLIFAFCSRFDLL